MRFINVLKNDVYFQLKYGFYFLYAFFSIVYTVLLMLVPKEYKNLAASLIILTDPAMLGIFFIGGIWLLEKGEGLHRFWSISPLRPVEYILSKSISLAILSTISAVLIVLVGTKSITHIFSLSISVFAGAMVFNLIGLTIASYARTVNHYMILASIPSVFLSIPPALTAFGITHPILEMFPGTALWHLIAASIDSDKSINIWLWLNLIPWFCLALFFANKRIGTALHSKGGASV